MYGVGCCFTWAFAWGTDEVELQPDFERLFDTFDRIGVTGNEFACLATGDSNFS